MPDGTCPRSPFAVHATQFPEIFIGCKTRLVFIGGLFAGKALEERRLILASSCVELQNRVLFQKNRSRQAASSSVRRFSAGQAESSWVEPRQARFGRVELLHVFAESPENDPSKTLTRVKVVSFAAKQCFVHTQTEELDAARRASPASRLLPQRQRPAVLCGHGATPSPSVYAGWSLRRRASPQKALRARTRWSFDPGVFAGRYVWRPRTDNGMAREVGWWSLRSGGYQPVEDEAQLSKLSNFLFSSGTWQRPSWASRPSRQTSRCVSVPRRPVFCALLRHPFRCCRLAAVLAVA
jgi:hypothetical protein